MLEKEATSLSRIISKADNSVIIPIEKDMNMLKDSGCGRIGSLPEFVASSSSTTLSNTSPEITSFVHSLARIFWVAFGRGETLHRG